MRDRNHSLQKSEISRTRFPSGAEEMVSPLQQDTEDLKESLDVISFQLKGIAVLLAVIILFLLIWFGTWLGRS